MLSEKGVIIISYETHSQHPYNHLCALFLPTHFHSRYCTHLCVLRYTHIYLLRKHTQKKVHHKIHASLSMNHQINVIIMLCY